jgi:hypothetical protein
MTVMSSFLFGPVVIALTANQASSVPAVATAMLVMA